jgi:hypothetical protein
MIARVLPFQVERATCSCCGATIDRRRGESWRRLCLTCWRWVKAREYQARVARLLRETG